VVFLENSSGEWRRGEARRKRRTGDFHDVEIIHQVVPG
jgi:hypothetical protein